MRRGSRRSEEERPNERGEGGWNATAAAMTRSLLLRWWLEEERGGSAEGGWNATAATRTRSFILR